MKAAGVISPARRRRSRLDKLGADDVEQAMLADIVASSEPSGVEIGDHITAFGLARRSLGSGRRATSAVFTVKTLRWLAKGSNLRPAHLKGR